MNAPKQLPEATTTLLAGFSPYLRRIIFDFATDSIEFHLLDRVEQPTSLRVLRFERLRKLNITPHDPADIESNCIDSIIGAYHDGYEFLFHTNHYEISFSSEAFHESTRNA